MRGLRWRLRETLQLQRSGQGLQGHLGAPEPSSNRGFHRLCDLGHAPRSLWASASKSARWKVNHVALMVLLSPALGDSRPRHYSSFLWARRRTLTVPLPAPSEARETLFLPPRVTALRRARSERSRAAPPLLGGVPSCPAPDS